MFQRENTLILEVPEEEREHVPEGRFRRLQGRLFYGEEMEKVFYDEGEDGEIRSYRFRVFEKDGFLCVDTELDLQKIELISEKTFRGIRINERI